MTLSSLALDLAGQANRHAESPAAFAPVLPAHCSDMGLLGGNGFSRRGWGRCFGALSFFQCDQRQVEYLVLTPLAEALLQVCEALPVFFLEPHVELSAWHEHLLLYSTPCIALPV
jgi:hypothetical protein